MIFKEERVIVEVQVTINKKLQTARTIIKTMEARLQTAEMWFLRRMMMNKISNDTAGATASQYNRQLMLTITTKQLRLVGHGVRK